MFGEKMSEERKMFCFEADVFLQREIKALACKKGVPLNQYMNELLRAHLDFQKRENENEQRRTDNSSRQV
jgi:hypothetical protein